MTINIMTKVLFNYGLGILSVGPTHLWSDHAGALKGRAADSLAPRGIHRRPPAFFWHARPPFVAGHLSRASLELLKLRIMLLLYEVVDWSLLGCSWECLAGDFGLLGVIFGFLGLIFGILGIIFGLLDASWAVLEAIKTSQNEHAKKKSTSRPPNVESCSAMGCHLGGQNRPKSDPKRMQI